jgi:hypothetical protein
VSGQGRAPEARNSFKRLQALTGAVAAALALGWAVTPSEGEPAPVAAAASAPAQGSRGSASTATTAAPTAGVRAGDAYEVDARWRLGHGVLGQAPSVEVRVETRYRVEVVAVRGERVRVRVTTLALERVERTPEGTRAEPQPLPASREHDTTAEGLLLVGAPTAGGPLGLPLAPPARLVAGQTWDRAGTVALLGLPVPVRNQLRCSRQGEDLVVSLAGAGAASVPGTEVRVALVSAGESRLDPANPGWPKRLEVTHRWEATGGEGDDVASSLNVTLSCTPVAGRAS